jgi:hypothetical protein
MLTYADVCGRIPAYDWGGSETDLCFTASDAPRAPTCAKRRNTAKHCVRVIVERCVYAIQPDQQLQEVPTFLAFLVQKCKN